MTGIKKMLITANIPPTNKLLKSIFRLNQKFGSYHTLNMLSDTDQLMNKCRNKREEALVKDFIRLWKKTIQSP